MELESCRAPAEGRTIRPFGLDQETLPPLFPPNKLTLHVSSHFISPQPMMSREYWAVHVVVVAEG